MIWLFIILQIVLTAFFLIEAHESRHRIKRAFHPDQKWERKFYQLRMRVYVALIVAWPLVAAGWLALKFGWIIDGWLRRLLEWFNT